MRHTCLTAVLLLGLATTAFAGTVPWVEPNPVPIPAGLTPEQVAQAIRHALEDQEWVVVEEAPGHTEATLDARGRRVRIRAEYDASRVRFVYVPGEKLEQGERDGRLYVDKVYEGWANDLVEVLASEFTPEPDDEAPPSMIGAEPATTSTARPVIRIATRQERTQGFSLFGNTPYADLDAVFDASGRDLLAVGGKRGLFHGAAPPTAVDPGTYTLAIGCQMSVYPVYMRKNFNVVLEAHPGLEYVIECIGRTGPAVRPQITPKALP